jgi:5-histidylcysteine sulfoxide synthase/putative 4-mercaptohistidine N1-methyltranferase
MNLTSSNLTEKREEIKKYFLDTYTQFENIFKLLKNDDIFYKKSESTRHPMIFYFGHTSVFFINKLINMKIISTRIDKEFESIFAIGVDEMGWDDINDSNYKWPNIEDVRDYRQKVKNLILKLIDTIPLALPIAKSSSMWIILMGIEHEKIHIETSLVLHRQMPLEFIDKNSNFKICDTFTSGIQNELIEIPSYNITLGKPNNHNLYGWDNEYGEDKIFVDKFTTSKYLVSNEEFMKFVEDDGYINLQYWCENGKIFLKKSKFKHPIFWIKDDKKYKYRTINKIIPMPLSWPVDINALEAKAFCRYKSIKENLNYTLPSEAQYKAIYKYANINYNYRANENLKLYSSVPIDTYSFNGIYDVVGNVWQWSNTYIYPFDGFKVHEAYDDFSVPTFDNKHTIINGSSWASTGNLIDSYSRYAFREHFYQNAGFRYVINDNNTSKIDIKTNIYETDNLVSQYCNFQYGQTYFGVENFSLSCMKITKKHIKNTKKVLDLGCATGRLSFELAKYFDKVDGIDFSTRFIQVGTTLQQNGMVRYKDYTQGELYSDKTINIQELGYANIKDKISFWQGDACNLKPNFTSYDMVLATNLIDRLYDPKLFLDDIKHRINKDGILILTSPYTWLKEYTKQEKWLGGYKNDKEEEVNTIDTLNILLKDTFKLIHTQDVPFVIKETNRKYQYTISHLSIWKKNEI